MRRRVVLGTYQPTRTIVHTLDARVKLGILLVATIACFAADTPWGLVVMAAGLVLALVASRTNPQDVLRALKPAAFILVLSILGNTLVLIGQPGISTAGFIRSATAIARIVLMVGFVLVFSATTLPPAIASALASAMSPLACLGVPVGDVAMTVSVALRFVPLTMEEVERIRAAQRARGAHLDEGGIVRRLRGWQSVLVPLLVSLFRRADELATAMCDRCYTGEQTSMDAPLVIRDWLVLAAVLLWAVTAIIL